MEHSEPGRHVCSAGKLLRGLCAGVVITTLPACELFFKDPIPSSDPGGGGGGSEMSPSESVSSAAGGSITGNPGDSSSSGGAGGSDDPDRIKLLACVASEFGVESFEVIEGRVNTAFEDGYKTVYVVAAYYGEPGPGCKESTAAINLFAKKVGLDDVKGCRLNLWENGHYVNDFYERCGVEIDVKIVPDPDDEGSEVISVDLPPGGESSFSCEGPPPDKKNIYEYIHFKKDSGSCTYWGTDDNQYRNQIETVIRLPGEL